MVNKKLGLAAAVLGAILLLAPPAAAQQGLALPGGLESDIRELLALTETEKIGDQLLDQIFTAYETMIPQVPREVWRQARREMRAKDLIERMVPIYARHFNREDIRALIEFYRSPVGKKYIERQGPIMKESMDVGMRWGQEVSKKVLSDLKSKGYQVPNSM